MCLIIISKNLLVVIKIPLCPNPKSEKKNSILKTFETAHVLGKDKVLFKLSYRKKDLCLSEVFYIPNI